MHCLPRSLRCGIVAACLVSGLGGASRGQEGVRNEFRFQEPNGTGLAGTVDSRGKAVWTGGLSGSTVQNGRFRIRRSSDEIGARYFSLDPVVRTGRPDSDDEPRRVSRAWLVMEVAGWNLRGDDVNEAVRIGFSSRLRDENQETLSTAALRIARTTADRVSISGVGFGQDGTDIEPVPLFPAVQSQPVTFVLELDKGTGDGGVYRLFYRIGESGAFHQAGDVGRVHRLRHGNFAQLWTQGTLGDAGEYFDISRITYTTSDPLGRN